MKIIGEYKCYSCKEVEAFIHLILEKDKVDKNREFFNTPAKNGDRVIKNVILFCDEYRKQDHHADDANDPICKSVWLNDNQQLRNNYPR